MYALCADAWFHAAKRKVIPSSTVCGFYFLLLMAQHYTFKSLFWINSKRAAFYLILEVLRYLDILELHL